MLPAWLGHPAVRIAVQCQAPGSARRWPLGEIQKCPDPALRALWHPVCNYPFRASDPQPTYDMEPSSFKAAHVSRLDARMCAGLFRRIRLATAVLALTGCRSSATYDQQLRMFLDDPGIDFVSLRNDEPLTFDFRGPTNLTDENGVPVMAEPLHVLVVTPSGGAQFISRDDGGIPDGQLTIQRPQVGRYRV